MSISHRFELVTFLGLAVASCYAGGPSDQADSGAEGSAEPGATDGAGTAEDGGGPAGGGDDTGSEGDDGALPDPPGPCLPGAIGCECLEGNCEGLGTCEDNICLPGPPVPDVDDDATAIAGVAIPLTGDVDEGDDEIVGLGVEWTQVAGPEATFGYASGADAFVYLPADAPMDTEFVFRLSATIGDVAASADHTVTIVAAEATGPMDESKEAIGFGGSAFAPRGGNDYWLGSAGGMFARVDDNAIAASYDLGAPIADIVSYLDGIVLVAQPDLQVVTGFNINNNMATPFLEELSGGGALGGVTAIAVDEGDNVYLGTTEGTVVYYDSPDRAEPATSTVLETLAVSPTALAVGQIPVPPEMDEDDEGNVLYIGASDGNVWQIGLSAPEDGSELELGTASLYLSVPGAGPVTGLAVDELGDMWVGKSSGIHLVRRQIAMAPSVVRTIAPTEGLEGFAGLRVDDNRLTWIDPASGRVGQLVTFQ